VSTSIAGTDSPTATAPVTVKVRKRASRPRLSWRDLASESVAGVLARPLRTLLTTLGTVLGIGALVATIGVSKTAGNQIVGRFSELTATQVIVQTAGDAGGGSGAGGGSSGRRGQTSLPWDVENRLVLNGVKSAGAYGDVDTGTSLVRSSPIRDPRVVSDFQLRVIAASPGLFDVTRATIVSGRVFDIGHSDRNERVAVLGAGAAKKLNITRLDDQPAIFIGSEAFTVIGIVDDFKRERSLVEAVILPAGTARKRFGTLAPTKVVIETSLGAAQLIAKQAPFALVPNDPTALQVSAPPDPKATRQKVEGDVNSLFLVLGLVSLVVGAIGIANVTLVTVLERVGEIGLRRALGAARRHIAYQFLAESTAIGLVGGVIGASVGVIVVVIVSSVRRWTPVLDAWVPLTAPALGALVGLLAGLYPSLRAANLEPVEALRTAT
jgi:ABC-type antimicrobial peptide transport system permease subunit